MQLNREAKLLNVIGLVARHADCRITFRLYPNKLFIFSVPVLSKKMQENKKTSEYNAQLKMHITA